MKFWIGSCPGIDGGVLPEECSMIEWYKALYFHMVEGSPENTVGKMPVDFVARITASLNSSFKNGSFSITSNHQYHYIPAIQKAVEFSKIVPSTNVPISCTLWPIILATNLTGIFSLWSLGILPPYGNIMPYTIQFQGCYWFKCSLVNRNKYLWVF